MNTSEPPPGAMCFFCGRIHSFCDLLIYNTVSRAAICGDCIMHYAKRIADMAQDETTSEPRVH